MRTGFALAAVLSAVFILAFAQPALADLQWQYNCTDGKFWANATLCIGSVCNNLQQPPIDCVDGCAENGLICNSAANVPSEYILISAMAFIAVAGLMFYLGYKVGNSDNVTKSGEYISLMFVMLGIILLITAIGVLGSFFTAQPDGISQVIGTGYTAFIIVFIVLVALFIAQFLFGHLNDSMRRKGYRK